MRSFVGGSTSDPSQPHSTIGSTPLRSTKVGADGIPGWRKRVRYVIVLLAIAGIVVSALALKVHYDTGSEPCRINDKWDCGVVNHSPYAVIHGVPVAAIGIAGYLLIAVLGFLRRRGLASVGRPGGTRLRVVSDAISRPTSWKCGVFTA